MTSFVSRALALFVSSGILFCTGSTCVAYQVILDAVEDTTIYSNLVDNNGGGHNFAVAGQANNGNDRRTLVRFDLSGIAPGSTINSARLDLNVEQIGNSGGLFQLFQVDTNWGEGVQTGNQGGSAAAGEATWNAAEFGSVNWATPGGTFFTPLLDDVSITSTGVSSFDTSANFVAAVQSQVDNPLSNFGFIILTSDTQSSIRIGSIEGDNAASLVVDFDAVPEPTGTSLLAFALAGLCMRRKKS